MSPLNLLEETFVLQHKTFLWVLRERADARLLANWRLVAWALTMASSVMYTLPLRFKPIGPISSHDVDTKRSPSKFGQSRGTRSAVSRRQFLPSSRKLLNGSVHAIR